MRYQLQKQYRLPEYDYSSNGYYFVTTCTKNRKHLFGKIQEKKMVLSDLGRIVEKYWHEIPHRFPSVALDEFIVMPNHFHGIIVLDPVVGTRRGAYLPDTTGNAFGPLQKDSLGSIVNHFKGNVTKQAKMVGIDAVWQPRFYDHVIRDEEALTNIREYIQFNPAQWDIDQNNPENLYM